MASRVRFCDLGSQRQVETFEPITGIREIDILCQIVCQLSPDQIGMKCEQCRRQKRRAQFIVPPETIFRQQKDGGASGEPERKPDLLPHPILPASEGNDGWQYKTRSEN